MQTTRQEEQEERGQAQLGGQGGNLGAMVAAENVGGVTEPAEFGQLRAGIRPGGVGELKIGEYLAVAGEPGSARSQV